MKLIVRNRMKTAKAFWICFLVLLAGLTMVTSIFVAVPDNTLNVPCLEIASESVWMDGQVYTPRNVRSINQDGDNYIDLYRDGNGDPQILIDGASPGVNDIYIGEPNVYLDVPLTSLKTENWNDRDGDDILYNVTLKVVDTATTCWDTESCQWIDADDYITWDIDTISPDYKDDNGNTGNALLIDGAGSKYIPWFYDDYNAPGFLDHDNDQRADSSEFERIWDDYKMYEGLRFDVSGDAPAGVYNVTLEITYRYQTFQNVSTQRLSGGGGGWYDPDNAGPQGTGDLGIFNYYFWEPYDINGGSVNFNIPDNIHFRKRANYAENNVEPTGAHWEAIPDLGYDSDNPNNYNSQGGAWDYHSNYDNDGQTSWDDGSAMTLNTVVGNWNSWGYNEYAVAQQSYIYRTVDQYPYNLNDGNGTWQYSGYEGETIWTEVKTEIEFVQFRVEHGIYFSQPTGDGCELVPDPANPYYLKAGDQFKKMYLRINNRDNQHPMTDVFVNITLNDQKHFTLKHDYAWKDTVAQGSSEYFYYRIDALNGTPVDRYSGTVTLTYTREGVRVTEDLPIEYILYFTPNLLNLGAVPTEKLEISKSIHTGQDQTQIDFVLTNYGNTLMENGMITMDFSDFKHNGEEYTDPEGGEGTYTQTLELPYLDHNMDNNQYSISVDVEIPNHWSLLPGVYKLLMDYDGYYFNDGVLGEPTNYVKVWMKWVDDDFDDDTDMNAYCVIDTDGDEDMEIFTDDETRAIDGIYLYVDVEEFIPKTPKLEVAEVSINGGSDTFEQGTITNGEVQLTLTNNGEADITDLYLELDLHGYFKGKQYYEGFSWNLENPEYYISNLNIGEYANATLEIQGIDKLLPPGTHKLKLIYTCCYDNGSTPSEISTDTEELYFYVTVTDGTPDIIPTVSSRTGIIRLGDKLVDIDLYVNLANREYYDLSDITATLTVGDDSPFIPGTNATLTGKSTVLNKWSNPAANYITSQGQNLDNLYFNLNLHPNAVAGTYFLDLNLNMFNERTMTSVSVPTTLEVKVYPKIAKLRITQVSVSTGSVKPGKEFTLDVTIQNDGGESAREIYVEFKEAYISGGALIETYDTVNPTGAKYPFSSDVMKAYIQEIQPYSTSTASFTVIGDLNIYPGVTYFQNIEFIFKDSTGYEHTSTDIAPINSDSSTTVKVDGDKYFWDTDREAWISETELAAEEVMDYMPWIIGMIIAIWLVTLLIAFMFIIRPKYQREKQGSTKDGKTDSNTRKPGGLFKGKHSEQEECITDSDTTSELECETETLQNETETDYEQSEDEDNENIVDYRNNNSEGKIVKGPKTGNTARYENEPETETPKSPFPQPVNPSPGGPLPRPVAVQPTRQQTQPRAAPPVSLAPPAPPVTKTAKRTDEIETGNEEDSDSIDWEP